MSGVSKNDSAFESNATGVIRCVDWPRCETREIDMAGWLFEKSDEKPSNLIVLPSLAVIIFIVLVCLKIYKWYKESVRRRERGDLEFEDESEVNYGIIKEGDKEFCRVEIRSDTTSVYDTVNSFRLFGNGHATCIGATPNYHDTVSSYKSLLLQRGDASHYDSVKSYKAFLKQVTQNKDLDVEVKLLENYPVKCKSTEHCVVVEEDFRSSLGAKSKLQPDGIRTTADGKKKFRYRRASGDPIGPMRKRSASNPTYNIGRPGATSLPSIHYSVSSESSNEEDTLSAFRTERRKAFEDRCKKISRSCSGSKLTKGRSLEEEQEVNAINKRKRHYSADGGGRTGRPLLGPGNMHFKISRAFQHELNNLRESISETEPKPEEHVMLEIQDESSSENPDSSPSSCNSSISSDAIESESDDETQQVTQISAMSDCTTFQSNDLGSSAELLSNQSASASLDGITNIGLCHSVMDTLSEDYSACSLNNHSSNHTEAQQNFGHSYSNPPVTIKESGPVDILKTSQVACHDLDGSGEPCSNELSKETGGKPCSANNTAPSSPSPSSNGQKKSCLTIEEKPNEVDDSEDTDNSLASNPRRVKRFHVTSVQGSDLSSQKSDCRRSSSGGSMLDS